MSPTKKYRPTDAVQVRRLLEIAVKSALQEFKQGDISLRVLESSVTHDTLVPEGELFNIRLRVEVHEKEGKESGIPMEQTSQS